jgi:hypothetical protein
MFAITTHLRDAEDQARQHRNVGVALVLATGFAAIIAGLLMNEMSSFNVFGNFIPL